MSKTSGRSWFFVVLTLFASLGWVHSAKAQPDGANEFARVKSISIEPKQVSAGQKASLLVTLDVAEGFHINANKPGNDMYVPTVLSLNPPKSKDVSLGQPVYPAARAIPVSFDPKPIKGYEQTIVIRVPVTVKAGAKPGVVALSGSLRAQGCNATMCFPPRTFPIAAKLTVTGGKK